ncbi:hypothetical protein KXW64_008670, partial [Aspergillus fumigatus]
MQQPQSAHRRAESGMLQSAGYGVGEGFRTRHRDDSDENPAHSPQGLGVGKESPVLLACDDGGDGGVDLRMPHRPTACDETRDKALDISGIGRMHPPS